MVKGLDIVQASRWYRLYQQKGFNHLLEELKRSKKKDWEEVFSVLVWIQREKDYHRLWLKHVLGQLKAPLEVWEMLAVYLNYHVGWAYHAQREAGKES